MLYAPNPLLYAAYLSLALHSIVLASVIIIPLSVSLLRLTQRASLQQATFDVLAVISAC